MKGKGRYYPGKVLGRTLDLRYGIAASKLKSRGQGESLKVK